MRDLAWDRPWRLTHRLWNLQHRQLTEWQGMTREWGRRKTLGWHRGLRPPPEPEAA